MPIARKSPNQRPISVEKPSILISEGLSNAEVTRRQIEEGFNELPFSKPKTMKQFIIELFRDPMVFLLVSCGLIYLTLGDPQEAMTLLGFLFVIIGITLYQERKAEHALEALRELSSPRALVLREGKKLRIQGKEVVRDDIVLIHEGDRVPADGVLVACSNVGVDESLLTGESVPVDKEAETSLQDSIPQRFKLYAGTTVVRGQGVMQVQAIALQTELGKIGKSIRSPQREYTHLEIETRSLVRFFTYIASSLCILLIIIYGLTRGDWLNGFLAGLTLAMAILPNELPAVLTIFLALGAWRMSQKRVLTRRIPAVENLGSTTVLCVDKTGTLTLNRMSIQELYAGLRTLDLKGLTVKALPEEFHEIIEFGILASRRDPFDPMEQAFLNAGTDFLTGTEHLHFDWQLKREYPLTTELLSISQVWKAGPNGENVVGAKGAPEAIIDLCHLQPEQSNPIAKKAQEMANRGLRVLGVAKAKVKSIQLPSQQHDFDFEFVGLVGLADPIRREVPGAIAECKTAGIRVLMITGDHPNTARSIAKQIGLQNAEKVITGFELNQMSDVELQDRVKNVTIFSRMAPEQKLRLVQALKKNGEIVAMTGDGVNDAPALRNAHIGIAMGGRGTDVARESAALVLLDDDFTSIVEAIRMGRRVYSNLRSALVYLLAVHIPIAGISVLPVLLQLPLVLLPVHIAFLHLIIEPACSIAFEAEPARSSIMLQPPRNPKQPLFDRKMWAPSLIQGTSVLIALLIIFTVSIFRGQGVRDGRALAFTSLIISNLVLILVSRSSSDSIKGKFRLTQNSITNWIIVGGIIVLALVLYVPILRNLFRFSTLHLIDILICLSVGVLSVIWFRPVRLKAE
jgi:Ca2+-transporting ATPase